MGTLSSPFPLLGEVSARYPLDPVPTFPLSVRQANALLVELGRTWIKNKDEIDPLLDQLQAWVNKHV